MAVLGGAMWPRGGVCHGEWQQRRERLPAAAMWHGECPLGVAQGARRRGMWLH